MTRGVHAACCFSQSLAAPSFHSIWISDALLADTYRRFAHRHDRHGSNISASLEARRKATRRRNASLAHTEASRRSLDPVVLLAARKDDKWWQRPNAPVESPPLPNTLPADLLKPRDPPRVAIDHTDKCSEQLAAKYYNDTVPSYQSDINALTTELRSCQNIHDVHLLLRKMGLSTANDPLLSTYVFAQILKDGRWDDSERVKYLTDPELNPPDACNNSRLLKHLQANPTTETAWASAHTALCKAAALGLISPAELIDAIELLSDIDIQNDKCQIIPRPQHVIHREHLYLLRSFQASKICALKDLGSDFLQNLHARFVRDTPSRTLIKLLQVLQPDSPAVEVYSLSSTVVESLKKDIGHQPPLNLGFKILQLHLTALPRVILCVTEMLAYEVPRRKDGERLFSLWRETLSRLIDLKGSGIELNAADLLSEQAEHPHYFHLRTRTILVGWLVFILDRRQHGASQTLSELKPDFERAFSVTDGTKTADVLAQVTITIQSLPLPHKHEFLGALRDIFEEPDIISRGFKAFDAMKGMEIGFTSLLDDEFYAYSKIHALPALTRVAESVNNDILLFQRISAALVHKNKTTFRLVTRTLQHNHAFKHALSQSFPQRVELQRLCDSLSMIPATVHAGSEAREPATGGLTPETALDHVNNLAISFALSEVVSARMAFLKVYWCWSYLHRHGAPIQAPITRAFWHAGVTRYGNEGCSPFQLKWVLERVELVEGKDVAQLLLWSSEFRNLRRMTLEQLRWKEDRFNESEHRPPEVGQMMLVTSMQNTDADVDYFERLEKELDRCQCAFRYCQSSPVKWRAVRRLVLPRGSE